MTDVIMPNMEVCKQCSGSYNYQEGSKLRDGRKVNWISLAMCSVKSEWPNKLIQVPADCPYRVEHAVSIGRKS